MVKTKSWQPIINLSSLSPNDFEFFGGIEELTDCGVIKAGSKKATKILDAGKITKKKPAKTSKRKLKSVVEEEINEHVETDAVENTEDQLDMTAWSHLYVPEKILDALKDLGFNKPTKIQDLSLPSAIRDHLDILAAAETGSGKTLAFGIPMLTHISNAKARNTEADQANKLRGLVLTPTRELAIQVKNHIQAVAKYLDIKIITVVGGMSLEKQRRLIQRSPDIIVATPGRLWQLMEEKEPFLESVPFVRYLVIDEADRMVEQGHFEELSKILEMMNQNKHEKRRQNFVFSATLTMVHDMPKRLQLKKRKKEVEKTKLESLMESIGVREKPKVIDITRKAGVVETLTESQINCSLEEKDLYLYYFVSSHPGRTLVFCNSISSVRRLKSVLEYLQCQPLTLHASMHQRQRLKNLDTFAASERGLLLATDVAARGLDIRGIEHVVHFQVPRTAEIYVHRSGRTARAQLTGLSLMLIEPQDGVFYKRICKTLNKDQTLPAFPVDQGTLKIVRERVNIARQIDLLEHRDQRLAAQNRWFLKAAEEMDIELDDQEMLNELGNERERAVHSKKLKGLKKQLSNLLKRPLIPTKFTGSYPTKSGKLVLPNATGSQKAIDLVENHKRRKH